MSKRLTVLCISLMTKLYFYVLMHADLPLPDVRDMPQKPVVYNLSAVDNALNKQSSDIGAGVPNIVDQPSSVTSASWLVNVEWILLLCLLICYSMAVL